MTEQDQLAILHQGRDVWNQWRQEHHAIQPDFSGEDFRGAHLSRVNLTGAILNGADFSGADLREALLIRADLSEAILSQAQLVRADLQGANLTAAILSDANLSDAVLSEADLTGIDFSKANTEITVSARRIPIPIGQMAINLLMLLCATLF